MGYSPWGRKESDTTERLTAQHSTKETMTPIRCEKAMTEKDRKEDNGLCPTNQINRTFPTEQWWKAGLFSFLYFLLMIQNSCILCCVHALSSTMFTSVHLQ